jgi:hypothetical protein
MDEIVNRVYGTDNSVRVASDILPRVHAAMQKLSSWIAALPPSLQLHEEMNPERECLLLQMMYNQVISCCSIPTTINSELRTSFEYSVLDHCYS